MLIFSDCKINLGLHILRRRTDGYHDIDTVMFHIPWHDIVEIVPNSELSGPRLTVVGRQVDCPPEKNLVMKAFRALEHIIPHPGADIILDKIVPDGAGLGGGSADAAYTLRLSNNLYGLGLDDSKLAEIAAQIGADCPFFIHSCPMHCTGTGTDLSPIEVSLAGYTVLVAKPSGVSISTKEAYAGVSPAEREVSVADIVALPIEEWQGRLVNDFESSIFRIAPIVGDYKHIMLDSGAVYASMSGSGASVYGIFRSADDAKRAQDLLPMADASFIHSF